MTEAGWFPDANRPGSERYWDGDQWTNQVRPAHAASGGAAPSGAERPAGPTGGGVLDTLGRGWFRFRRWRWYWQALLWLIPPVPFWMYVGSRPKESRRSWVWAGVAATLIYAAIAVAGNTNPSDTEADASQEAATAASVTTTDPVPTGDQPTTGVADPPAPSTTRPPSTTQVPTTQEATTTRPPTTTTVPEAERDGDSANPGAIYPGRPDIQDYDHERQLGAEPVRFAGFSVSVLSAEYVDRASDYQCCGYLRVRVRILNRDDEQQSWSRLDFSLARPSGEVYSPTVVVGPDDQLGLSGSLVHGGVAEGDLWFSVDPDVTGDYFIYWEPSYKPYETDRGIWRFTR